MLNDEKNCLDESDEKQDYSRNLVCSKEHILCNQQCVPKHLKCDLNQDCKYGTDEKDCQYYNQDQCKESIKRIETKPCYIEYNSMGRMISKIHIPLTTIRNCSAEIVCEMGYYQCQSVYYCISIEQVCDNVPHCPNGDDEIGCS
ncbi:unnamed protein product [Dimorphilus gyrociliatus]|uniref:Uncharacterized protein n=1 Tax=Dimorphilus gyrociliatus TaxID=2664684 RepID=A0A7I8WDQ9_9ANNE|nr:unnamed protein product [Dimorphilus gyrociliatus]